MQEFSASPKEMFASVWRNRELIRALTRREIAARYRGSFLGIFWSFFNPIFMLAVYTFVFSVVFQARWNGGTGSKTEFALILYVGMVVFGLFSECVNHAPDLILANVSYVKKVVFPLEILIVVDLGSALFNLLTNLLIWLVFYLVFFGVPPVTLVLFPFILLPLVFMTGGVAWLLAALGVYLRDIGQMIGVVITALMFLTPIFYQASTLPIKYQKLVGINPLAVAVESSRQVMIWGKIPRLESWLLALMTSVLFAWFGFVVFQKLRRGFADVI